MKTLLSLCTVLLFLVGCADDEKKTLSEKFDKLQRQHDSISQVHMTFKSTHGDMFEMHKKFTEKLTTVEIQDSTILENVAKHEAILKKHDAMLEGHDKMIAAHKELRQGFGEKTAAQMEVQLDEMIATHNKLVKEHNAMEDEHDMMQKEHNAIMNKLERDADN